MIKERRKLQELEDGELNLNDMNYCVKFAEPKEWAKWKKEVEARQKGCQYCDEPMRAGRMIRLKKAKIGKKKIGNNIGKRRPNIGSNTAKRRLKAAKAA